MDYKNIFFQENETSNEMASDTALKKTMQFVHQKTKGASLGKIETKKSEPEHDILQCFRQHGFRPEGVALPGEDVEENMIKFSEKEAPLYFLIAMGFTFDKSSLYVKDRELNGRLIAAIKEARVWVNKMHKSRGQLIFSLAFHASYKVKKYFASLVEAIVNRRINSDVTLYEYLNTLEKLEDGVLTLNQLQGIYKITDDDMSEEEIRKRDLRKLFLRLYEMVKQENETSNEMASDTALKKTMQFVHQKTKGASLGKIETKKSEPEHDILQCFRQHGFRPEGVALPGEDVEENMIKFSEKEAPLYFLIAMGFTFDKSSLYVKDRELNGRLIAAIKEARVWVNKMHKSRGQLIFSLAFHASYKVKKYFASLVEAIVNRRINSDVTLYEYLNTLEKLEDGVLTLNQLQGIYKITDDDMSEEEIRKRDLRKLFLRLYEMVKQENETSNEMASDTALKKTMQFVHQKTKGASLGKIETKKSEPEHDILQCFRQHGFRPEGVALPGEDVEENMIKFSEKEAPLYFLIAMGFTFDKSSLYVKDRELNGRLIAAIKEARVWVNKMHKSRGQLIFSLAFHASYKVKKYFASLVEAIVNRRINSDVTLYEYLNTLEKLEDGVLTLNQLQGIYKITDDDMSEEEIRKRDLRKLFLRLYEMVKQENETSNEMASDTALKKTMQFVHQKTKGASLGKIETKKSEPEHDILQCFRQHGFRPEGVALPGEDVEENMIKFSEKEAPLYFLIAMGFTFDKSSLYVKDRELNGRLIAAIKEARVWVNKMHKSRGQLIFSLAFHASYKVKKYFASLVEAIVNRRINSDVTLYEYLNTLEKLEDGVLTLNQLQGIYKITDDDMSEEEIRKRDLRKLFLRLYEMVKQEGTQIGLKAPSFKIVTLVHLLANRFKPSLYEHIPLLSQYIGQNIIRTDIELEGALMYLSVIKWESLDMDDFHKFCGIKVR